MTARTALRPICCRDVAELGDTDAPTVLLLHGFPQHWYMWRVEARNRHALSSGIPNNVKVALVRVSRSDGREIDWQQSSPMMSTVPAGLGRAATRKNIERTLLVNVQVGRIGAVVSFAARPQTADAIYDYFPAATQIRPLPVTLPTWGDCRGTTRRSVAAMLRLGTNPFGS